LPFYYSGKKVGKSSTFPIAIGRKNEDHEPVEKLFCEEMKLLCSDHFQCYNKNSGTLVAVYMELIASLQDQPECCSCNSLMLGTGRYSSW